jgi:hypothetical protein
VGINSHRPMLYHLLLARVIVISFGFWSVEEELQLDFGNLPPPVRCCNHLGLHSWYKNASGQGMYSPVYKHILHKFC